MMRSRIHKTPLKDRNGFDTVRSPSSKSHNCTPSNTTRLSKKQSLSASTPQFHIYNDGCDLECLTDNLTGEITLNHGRNSKKIIVGRKLDLDHDKENLNPIIATDTVTRKTPRSKIACKNKKLISNPSMEEKAVISNFSSTISHHLLNEAKNIPKLRSDDNSEMSPLEYITCVENLEKLPRVINRMRIIWMGCAKVLDWIITQVSFARNRFHFPGITLFTRLEFQLSSSFMNAGFVEWLAENKRRLSGFIRNLIGRLFRNRNEVVENATDGSEPLPMCLAGCPYRQQMLQVLPSIQQQLDRIENCAQVQLNRMEKEISDMKRLLLTLHVENKGCVATTEMPGSGSKGGVGPCSMPPPPPPLPPSSLFRVDNTLKISKTANSKSRSKTERNFSITVEDLKTVKLRKPTLNPESKSKSNIDTEFNEDFLRSLKLKPSKMRKSLEKRQNLTSPLSKREHMSVLNTSRSRPRGYRGSLDPSFTIEDDSLIEHLRSNSVSSL